MEHGASVPKVFLQIQTLFWQHTPRSILARFHVPICFSAVVSAAAEAIKGAFLFLVFSCPFAISLPVAEKAKTATQMLQSSFKEGFFGNWGVDYPIQRVHHPPQNFLLGGAKSFYLKAANIFITSFQIN
jgi:hypothetical protein